MRHGQRNEAHRKAKLHDSLKVALRNPIPRISYLKNGSMEALGPRQALGSQPGGVARGAGFQGGTSP